LVWFGLYGRVCGEGVRGGREGRGEGEGMEGEEMERRGDGGEGRGRRGGEIESEARDGMRVARALVSLCVCSLD
jgi:hypothetical protein